MTTGAIVPKNLGDFLRAIPYEVTGQWFYQKKFCLDGYAFTNCRFDGCTLLVSRGIFRLTSCYMAGCTFYYNDEARNVIRLFTGMHVPKTVELVPGLRPAYNVDGTFTIDPSIQ